MEEREDKRSAMEKTSRALYVHSQEDFLAGLTSFLFKEYEEKKIRKEKKALLCSCEIGFKMKSK